MIKSTIKQSQSWPTFIVIGPGKSGTSWLYEIFGNHPKVGMSSAKETLFFESEFERGLNWYAKFFRGLDSSEYDAIGEISNTYIFSPLAAKRIFQSFPEMKIIATLRNPIDRAFSHFLFERRNGKLSDDFDKALEQRPDLLTRGLYNSHLEPYYRYSQPEQRLILIYDDMLKDVVTYANSIFQFLNVTGSLDEGILRRRVLGASEARNRTIARFAVNAGLLVRRLGFPEVVTVLKNTPIAKSLFRPIDPTRKPQMSKDTRVRLQEFFRSDVEQLSQRLDRDLVTMWLS